MLNSLRRRKDSKCINTNKLPKSFLTEMTKSSIIEFKNHLVQCFLNIDVTPCKQLYLSFLQNLIEESFSINYFLKIKGDKLLQFPTDIISKFGTLRLENRFIDINEERLQRIFHILDLFTYVLLSFFNCKINELNQKECKITDMIHLYKKLSWLCFLQIEAVHVTCKSLVDNNKNLKECCFRCQTYDVPYIIVYLVPEINLLRYYEDNINVVNEIHRNIKIIFDCTNIENSEKRKQIIECIQTIMNKVNTKQDTYFVNCGDVSLDTNINKHVKFVDVNEIRKILKL